MTRRCFVIGHPIAHSRSPLIHGTWLAEHGLDGSYERIDVAPADLPAFIEQVRAGAFVGGNVTVPLKEAVLPLLDDLTETARTMGAVNTIWTENGRLLGDNTDGTGFLSHLDASVPDWAEKVETALLFGAGGAARGIAHAFAARGVPRIILVNRTAERAEMLARDLRQPVQAAPWADHAGLVGQADLIVNTTALGMKGQPPLDLDLDALRPRTIVDDIVYLPLKTALLSEAETRGARIVDGLGMLLHQAVPGFERWFGVRPSVTPALRRRLENDILAV